MSFPLLFAPACVLISPYIRYEMEEPQPAVRRFRH